MTEKGKKSTKKVNSGSKTSKPLKKVNKITKKESDNKIVKKDSGSKTTKPLKKVTKTTKQESNNKEVWKPFPHELFKEKYKVSNKGRVCNIKTRNILAQTIKNGYCYCVLMGPEKKLQSFRTHRVVAKLFVKNPDKEINDIVNHLDGNRFNNHYQNLEWTTIKGNNQHAADNNLTGKTTRRVAQYDMKDNLIKNYKTLTQAYNETGISSGAIVDVCKGKWNHAGGYQWRYIDENPNEKEVDLKKENFKQVKTFPNYWINNKGQVYSKPFKKFMKLGKHKNGALQIQFTRKKEGGGQIKKTVLVHNLVGIYFLKKSKDDKVNCMHHKDGDKTNNNVKNLEWCYVGGANPDLNI